jgi:ribosomal protein S18 acetylase RimI-like enzyme
VREADGLAVRLAQDDDLYGAAVARVASWRGAFTGLVPQDFLDAMDPAAIATAWKGSIAAGRSRLYVAASDHQIVGYSSVGPAREGPADTGELYALFVHPDWWGTNAGRQLTDAAIADLQAQGCVEVWLWVLEANARARAFYRRYGFAETPARTTSSLNNLPELRPHPGPADRQHSVTGNSDPAAANLTPERQTAAALDECQRSTNSGAQEVGDHYAKTTLHPRQLETLAA